MSDFIDFDPDGDEVVNRELIEHEKPFTDRTASRRIALQALYEVDTTEHKLGDVLNYHVTVAEEPRRVLNYAEHLIKGVLTNQDKLDELIQSYAPEWPIAQLSVIDRNVLRLSLFEFGVETQTPLSVAIDEAIRLAHIFGAENSSKFINGVLGTIADDLDRVRATLSSAE